MRKPASSSDACTSHAAIESRLAARSATPTGKVMTFETTRMRKECESSRNSIVHHILAMRTNSDRVGVAWSFMIATPRLERALVR